MRLPPSKIPPATMPAARAGAPQAAQAYAPQGQVPAAATMPSEDASRTPAPVSLTAGPIPAARLSLRRAHDALVAELDLAASALPPEAKDALRAALLESAERILVAFDTGRINADEAERATRMLAEMTGALVAIERGHIQVSKTSGAEQSDLLGYEVKTTTGDVLRVGVRPLGNERGEARVKIENIVDDGVPVPKQDRLMIRFDLEGSGQTSARRGARAMLDLQFGHERFSKDDPREKLNKRIHGVLLDEHGQPVANRGGNTIADHHFRAGIPSSLDSAEGFRRFVGAFLSELEGHPADGAS